LDDKELFNHIIGQAIRDHREKHHMTLEQLASITQLDEKHLGRLERGEKTPLLPTFYKITIALNLSVDKLFQDIQKQQKKRE
jgi:transcriptional regulator with XRE-family HTH domain